MFSVNTLGLSNVLDELDKDPISSKKILSVAVGIQAGRQAQLPSVQLDITPDEFFRMNLVGSVRTYINDINEQHVLDVEEAEETAKEFWKIRYNTLHNTADFLITRMDGYDDIIHSIAQVPFQVSTDRLKYLKENSLGLIKLINVLNKK